MPLWATLRVSSPLGTGLCRLKLLPFTTYTNNHQQYLVPILDSRFPIEFCS